MDDPVQRLIAAEADRMRRHLRGALEYEDLVGAGWLAALTAPAGQPRGALRLRIRGAIFDTFRREWRQLGRVARSIRWPVYWPTRFHAPGQPDVHHYRRPYRVRRCVDCGVEIAPTGGCRRCPVHAAERRLVLQRVYNQNYYYRRHAG